MNLFLYRQNRQYFGYLSAICLAMLFLLLFSGCLDLVRSRDLILLREKQMVSALLAEGLTPAQIAAVCSGTEVTEDGKMLLLQMGHSEHTSPLYFPLIRSAAVSHMFQKAAAGAVFGAVVLFLAAWYMGKLDRLYAKATELVEHYAEGDFTEHLPMGDQQGTICRLFASIDQLSRALKVQYESERASREFLKNIISDISHQLKTPLAALNIYNGLLQNEAQGLPAVKEFAELSEQELDRIETLVQNLLKIAKLDAGVIAIEKGMENVADMMRDIELHFAYRARTEQKEMKLSGPDQAPFLCDRDWLMEAVDNIVKNAFDHTEPGDTVSVEWSKSGSVVQIVITDNGNGIHPEDLYHIFKRFYRSRFSKDTHGLGLGLPLAKAIIEAHKGTIEVSSEPGIGTAFVINFLIPTKL